MENHNNEGLAVNHENRLCVNRPYYVIADKGSGEIVEKKSRFIANLAPVESEEDALRFIEEVKKKYWDARHNCWAYIIGRQGQLVRASDDGEPQGTAGRPILEVLGGSNLTNVVAVVTRYFGGVLLGTGGLVRAYTQAAQEAVRSSVIIQMRYGNQLTVTIDYPDVGKLQYWLGQRAIPVLRSQYEVRAQMDIMIPFEDTEEVIKDIAEATMGRALVSITDSRYYS
ncbi:MAG: YigZ family protein [Lachnospiraceae bacterium]|jgi:uncharacterized YigZ family protein|nr:YigZ family protein [Lachnospiraceae bacterium]